MAKSLVQQQQAAVKAGNGSSNKKTLQTLIKSMEPEIAKALPSVITLERFVRITMTAISVNPKLAECTPESFLGAMMQAAQLGLEPNTPLGLCFLIPRWNGKKGCLEAHFELGYQGLKDLAYRSGEVSLIEAKVVYSNDDFACEFGLDPKLKLVPADGDRGTPIKVYALYKTKSGSYGFDVASVEEIRNFAKEKSQAYNNGPWQTDFLAMAKKTVLKSVLKTAPIRSEFARQIAADDTVKTKIDADMLAFGSDDPQQESTIEPEYSVLDAVDDDTGEVGA